MADVSILAETSMSINVSWIMHRHGSHPPVTVCTAYKPSDSDNPTVAGCNTTYEEGTGMYKLVYYLEPSTSYDIAVIAENQRGSSNRASYDVHGETTGNNTLEINLPCSRSRLISVDNNVNKAVSTFKLSTCLTFLIHVSYFYFIIQI